MMDLGDLPRTVAKLDAAFCDGTLSERDQSYCAQLRDSLTRHARIVLLGLPSSHIAPVRGALIGDPDVGISWPDLPLEVSYGDAPGYRATLSDGSTLCGTDLPPADVWARPVAFMRLSLPLPALHAMTVLSLPLRPADLTHSRALAWAAQRSEIAVWCARNGQDLTAELWARAPDRLKNYAYLIVTDEAEPYESLLAQKRRYGFDGAFSIRDGLRSLEPFVHQLTTDIDDARRADLDAVELFLHRRGLGQIDAEPTAMVPGPVAPRIIQRDPDRLARFSEPILYLKRRAKALSEILLWPGEISSWADEVLTHCCETTDGLRERAYDWPEDDTVSAMLSETIEDACDAAVLMQIEAGPEQAEDAAALLLQLRGAFEQALAA